MTTTKVTSELKLGDVVQVFEGPYGTATVKQIKDGFVTFFRPYTAAENWSHTGGVICYIGLEEFKVSVSSTSTWKVWREGKVS